MKNKALIIMILALFSITLIGCNSGNDDHESSSDVTANSAGEGNLAEDEKTTEDKNTSDDQSLAQEGSVEDGQYEYTLRELADRQGILIGGACEPYHLEEEAFAETFKTHYNQITPENRMKMGLIHPERDTYYFDDADKIVAFAMENDMTVRGHTLVWHIQQPDWITNGDWTREELMTVLEDHIKTVVGHYKGQVAMWDVVNEALELGSYRESVWYEVIGPEYIEMAFKWAHEADPDAKLYINDYFIEETNAKSTALYNIVVDLLEKDVPIHGVGLQGHIVLDAPYDMTSVYSNIKRFNDLGLDVSITEIDVRIPGTVTEDQLLKQAAIYEDLFELAAGMDGVNCATMWGLSDKYTWVTDYFEGYGSPLLFDENYEVKPAFDAVYKVLSQDEVVLDYEKRIESLANDRVVLEPLVANVLSNTPEIDGVINDGEWDNGVNYTFAYNQLDGMNQGFNTKDIYGEFTLGYKDGYFYGFVKREDDITYTDAGNSWENDCVEVFISHETLFSQLRSLVGEDFAMDPSLEDEIAVWNEDGSVMEYSFKLPVEDPSGLKMGFNIALADNDGMGREVQLYPITGKNVSYMGKDLIGIKFEGDTPRPSEALWICPAFVANTKVEHPVLDGLTDDYEWYGGVDYTLGYNQLNELDQSIPGLDNAYVVWKLLYEGNQIFGQF